MSKKRTHVDRRMISVPAHLNDRMSKLAEENWSAIACRAFEQRLGELAAQKKEKNMSDVIERLRASRNAGNERMFEKGKEDGYEWARSSASAAELKRLDQFHDAMEREPR